MKSNFYAIALVLFSGLVSYTRATVGGQYTVNVQFVPPILTQQCAFGQFWNPDSIPCATCFCLTGSISRCVPTPGCNPMTVNATTTTTTAAPASDVTVPVLDPEGSDSSNTGSSSSGESRGRNPNSKKRVINRRQSRLLNNL